MKSVNTIIVLLSLFYSAIAASTQYDFLTGTWSGKCKNITSASINKSNNTLDEKSIITSSPNLTIKHNKDFVLINVKWNINNNNKVGYDHVTNKLANRGESSFIGLVDTSNHKEAHDKIIAVNTAENMMMVFSIINKQTIISKQFRAGKHDALAGKCFYYKNNNYT